MQSAPGITGVAGTLSRDLVFFLFGFRSESSTLLVRDTSQLARSRSTPATGPWIRSHAPAVDWRRCQGNLRVLGRDVHELTKRVKFNGFEFFIVEQNIQMVLKEEQEAQAHPPPKFTRTHCVFYYFPTLLRLHPRHLIGVFSSGHGDSFSFLST